MAGSRVHDVLAVIKEQHRAIDSLLNRATKAVETERGDAKALLQQVADLLIPHSEAEESFVYPTIERKEPDESDEVHDGAAEHHHIEGVLRELLAEDVGEPGFDGKLAALVGELRHHVEEEESELLPALAEKSSADELASMGQRFATETGWMQRRDAGSGNRRGERSKEELYEQAKKQDVPGRSSMSKAELAAAVDGEGDDGEAGKRGAGEGAAS